MQIQKFYQLLMNWLVLNGPRFIAGIIVLFIGLWFIRILTKWSHNSLHEHEIDPTVKPFLLSLVGVGLRAILVLGVMQIVGIELSLFTAVVGAFGVAAGLALSGTLQNFASGVLILLLKPFIVGDNIITQGLEGTVTSIQIFYTLVLTFDNRTVVVPNSKLSNEVIINMSREGTRRLDIKLKFATGTDIVQIKKILNKAIDKCEQILKSPERRIGVAEIQPDGFLIGVDVWINAHGFYDTKLAVQEVLLQDIKDAKLV